MTVLPGTLIARKRDGHELSEAELAELVGGYVTGEVGEGQMAAFLMAGVIRGFSEAEALALNRILADSGDKLDLSALPGPTVDKHSTGGVADGTTLVVAPLLAACGAQLVKLSGRGLGHTGGTLDKLEAIPGLRVDLDEGEMLAIVEDVGCVVAAQTDRLVPADRALYALRDVTATVESVALIASSVMSKKLAAGASTIVLDVKAGEGAFMATEAEAAGLAELCVAIGAAAGRNCVALVTAMDQPLGRGVGNALEVAESVELLSAPPGDASSPGSAARLADVALALAAEALSTARGTGVDAARDVLVEAWSTGAALEHLRAMVAAQGGDPSVCDRPREVLPATAVRRTVPAPRAGVVSRVPARRVGELAAWLGAGRARKGDTVDPAVGVELDSEIGSRLSAGDALATVHARTDAQAEEASRRLAEMIELDGEVRSGPSVLRRVT